MRCALRGYWPRKTKHNGDEKTEFSATPVSPVWQIELKPFYSATGFLTCIDLIFFFKLFGAVFNWKLRVWKKGRIKKKKKAKAKKRGDSLPTSKDSTTALHADRQQRQRQRRSIKKTRQGQPCLIVFSFDTTFIFLFFSFFWRILFFFFSFFFFAFFLTIVDQPKEEKKNGVWGELTNINRNK